MVVHPARPRRNILRLPCLVQIPIHVEPDDVGFPFHGKDMEIVAEFSAREDISGRQGILAEVAGAMQTAVHLCRFFADVLHDVDLAAKRPFRGGDIVAEHPERRPDSLALRDPDPCFEASVLLSELPCGLQPCRGVTTCNAMWVCISLARCCYDKLAVLLMSVLRPGGVILQLVVSPAVAAGLDHPFSGVWRRSVCAVELIAPHENPSS